jgi:glycosyltransferase involved in cell wall biosynthesis
MIAYFVYHLDSYSGAAQQALLLAKEIKQKVIIFNHTDKKYKRYKENDLITIIDLPKNNFSKVGILIILYTLKYNIKIYHLHGFFKIGLIIGKLLQRKIILKTTLLDNDDFDTFKNKKGWLLNSFLFKSIYKNIVLSEKIKGINAKYLKPQQIELIPNGVTMPEACPALEEKENDFCFIGIVCKRKRTYESILYFIKHFSYIKNSMLYIVGPCRTPSNNSEYDKEYVNKCFTLVKDYKLQDRIIFTDLITKQETHNILRSAKALLFFSDKEGMPNAVLEALSYNCVPITGELDGVMREIIEDRKHGFILNQSLPKIEYREIDKLIKNKTPYLLALNKFSINNIGKKYVSLYAEL